jgi:hypothetical protein
MGACCKCLPRPHHLHHGGAAPDIGTLPAEAPTPVLLHGVLEITIAEMDTRRLPEFLQVWFLVSQGVLVQKLPVCLNCGKASQLSLLEIHLRTNVKGINVIRYPA